MQLECDYASDLRDVVARSQSQQNSTHDLSLILNADIDNKWGEAISDQFLLWRDTPYESPSLINILIQATDFFEIDSNHPIMSMAMTACLLGDIPNKNPYHNNPHFREVTCILLKLCAVHNNVEKNENLKLNADDILLLIATAAVHDFAHDGMGNIIDGMHVLSRTENNSINKIKPFFDSLNLDKSVRQKMDMMILCTDVIRGKEGRSRAGYARDIFMAHDNDNVSIVNAPDEYRLLLDDHKLSLMTMMLCEADLAMSSGLDYEFSKEMTKLVASESSVVSPSAKTLHSFMDVICHGGYITNAAKSVLGGNFESIFLSAEADSAKNILYSKIKP